MTRIFKPLRFASTLELRQELRVGDYVKISTDGRLFRATTPPDGRGVFEAVYDTAGINYLFNITEIVFRYKKFCYDD